VDETHFGVSHVQIIQLLLFKFAYYKFPFFLMTNIGIVSIILGVEFEPLTLLSLHSLTPPFQPPS